MICSPTIADDVTAFRTILNINNAENKYTCPPSNESSVFEPDFFNCWKCPDAGGQHLSEVFQIERLLSIAWKIVSRTRQTATTVNKSRYEARVLTSKGQLCECL